jgi:cell division protein FtsL
MTLNDTLLTIIRMLYIVLLLVVIYTAVEAAYFVHDTRLIMTEKVESGEIFADIAQASSKEIADRVTNSAAFQDFG